MSKKSWWLLIFVLLIALSDAGNVKRLSRKGYNVLILHSYNSTYVWSNEITRGISEYFDHITNEKVNLYLEYLDAKRYPDEGYLDKMYVLIREKYQEISDIDLIIASDNQALSFMQRYGESIFPEVPVVFCGINYLQHFDLKKFPNYTGISEEIRPDLTVEQILKLQPEVKKLFLVSDCNTKTGISAIKQARKDLSRFSDRMDIEYPLNYTMNELEERLRNLESDYAVLLLIFNLDRDGDFFEVEEAAELISAASRVPVYTCWNFHLGRGVVGGALTCGYSQGWEAGRLAWRIFQGENPRDIPIIEQIPVIYKFDQSILDKYGLKSSYLDPSPELINVPSNYLKDNWKTFLIFIIIVSVLTAYILILLRTQKHLKISRQSLKQKDIEWNKLVGSLPGLVFRIDSSLKFLYINSYFNDLLRKTPSEIIGRHLTELRLGDEIIEVNQQAAKKAFRSGKTQKVQFKFGTGSKIRAFETTIQPEFDEKGKITTLLGIVYDLTERYKTEQKLISSEKRANEARRIARLGFWELDVETQKMSWSPEFSEILGVKHEPEKQSLSFLCESLNQPQALLLREIKRRAIDGELKFDHVYKVTNVQGEQKYLHERGELVIDNQGRAVNVYGTVQDITHEKLAEQQIRSSEAKFRAIFENAPMGISLLDRELKFVYYNPKLLGLSGYTSIELETMEMKELIYPDDVQKCLQNYRQLFAGDINQFTVRKRLLCQDGRAIWTLTTVTVFYSEEENRQLALSMELDIHSQVIAEEMVAESQQLLKEAQQIAKFGYWKYDPQEEMMICSEEMANILGYEVKEALNLKRSEFTSYLSEETREKFLEQLQHCVVMGTKFELAAKVINRSQDELQANIRMASLQKESGKNFVLGTFIDITVMKSIQSQLRQVEARFRLFFENSPLGIVILDGSELINLVNPAILRIWQVSEPDVKNQNIAQFLLPQQLNDFQNYLEMVSQAERGSYTAEYQMKRRNGSYLWCSVTITRLESDLLASQGVMLLIEDINERKLAREQLKESEEKYRSVFEVSRDGLFLTNADSNQIMEVNTSGAEMFEYKKEELRNMIILELAADRHKMLEALNRRDELILNVWGQPRKSSIFPMEISLNYFQRNGINYHIASIRNISERLQFETELRESEKKFRTIVENAPLGIIFVDEKGSIIFSNQVIMRMLHCQPNMRLDKLDSLLVVESRDLYKIILEDLFLGERTEFLEEAHILRQDGSRFWGNILISVVHTDKEKSDFAIIMIQDVTQQREVEEKLHLYEKLESIGQLAGMIAHDFNNQLMGVLGYATILQEQLKDEKLRNYAQMIYNSAETSAALTQQLLSFARKGRHVTVNQDLHKLIQETLSLVRATIQTKIKVVLKLDAKKSIIPADPGQVQNAILNLVLNACDAMPEGGELVISTQALKLTEEDSGRFFEEVTAGRYLLLRISDTGQGMTSEVKKHIFEPFYTTKQEGKGTGLGLPAVFGTVKSHQGYLNFHTVENEGTSFDLYFPLADVQVEDETNSSSRGYSIHGTGNIIIIDDEPIVRKTVHTLLETLGYSVKTFQGGKEALLYFRDNWEEIDLILLDVIMPEMDGPQIFVKLKEINPAVKVLLFSAYSATSDVQAALDNGALGFIHKPILRDELSQKISQAMADQRVNNLRSLFGVKESKRVDINEEMINKMKNGIVDQFMFIIQNLEAAVKEDDTRKIDIILPSLELILRKVKIKSLAKLIKDLKADLKKEKSSPLEIILLMKQQFLQELD